MTPDIAAQIREIRRARIEAARLRHPIDKALAGAELYDMVRERMAWGVKLQMPDADEVTVHRMVQERLGRRWEKESAR